MSFLPPKKGPQEWEDVPLPIFGDGPLPEKQTRQRSKKDEDDEANKLTYRSYKGASRQCDDCRDEVNAGKKYTFARAVFIRIHRGDQRHLCYEHKALRVEAEALGNSG